LLGCGRKGSSKPGVKRRQFTIVSEMKRRRRSFVFYTILIAH